MEIFQYVFLREKRYGEWQEYYVSHTYEIGIYLHIYLYSCIYTQIFYNETKKPLILSLENETWVWSTESYFFVFSYCLQPFSIYKRNSCAYVVFIINSCITKKTELFFKKN